MTIPSKLAAFAAALAVAFGAALGVGSAVGPVGTAAEPAHSDDGDHSSSGEAQEAAAEEQPGGLQISQDGYTLALTRDTAAPGRASVSFLVLGPDGEPVTSYAPTHDKDLHLIVVRRDMAGFQHVHPRLAADGTWTAPLSLTPGTWRVFADFAPSGRDEAIILGADLAVGGAYDPQPLPEPATDYAVDGYTVALDGTLRAGESSTLTLSVRKNGRPVTDLQPYLAAYGHLVALRDGDLAYLHVHPGGEPGDGTTKAGPDITFHAVAPSAGAYRLFLDFQHGGVVRTAEFTVHAEAGGPSAGNDSAPGSATHDDHSD